LALSLPKIPRQVEKNLKYQNSSLSHISDGLLLILNSRARKGRLYTLTDKARRRLRLHPLQTEKPIDWDLLGKIISSPKQKLVVLKALDSVKGTSENLRERAERLNPHLSRISIKKILSDLINGGLVRTDIRKRKRYYWISNKGKVLIEDLAKMLPSK